MESVPASRSTPSPKVISLNLKVTFFCPFFRYHACSLARNATFTGVLVTGGREGGLDGAASSELMHNIV